MISKLLNLFRRDKPTAPPQPAAASAPAAPAKEASVVVREATAHVEPPPTLEPAQDAVAAFEGSLPNSGPGGSAEPRFVPIVAYGLPPFGSLNTAPRLSEVLQVNAPRVLNRGEATLLSVKAPLLQAAC